MTEAIRSSETSILPKATRRHISENGIPHVSALLIGSAFVFSMLFKDVRVRGLETSQYILSLSPEAQLPSRVEASEGERLQNRFPAYVTHYSPLA
jgi:hypothetical protein